MRPLNPHCLALGALFWIATPATWMQGESNSGMICIWISFIVLLLEIKVKKERWMRKKDQKVWEKVWYFNDPPGVIFPQNEGEQKMTEWRVRGKKSKRHRAKSKNIIHLRLFQTKTSFKKRLRKNTHTNKEAKREREDFIDSVGNGSRNGYASPRSCMLNSSKCEK